MAGTLSSRGRSAASDYIWPGYVDALTTLLMVLIFLLSVFSVAQFSLSTALSTKDSAIDTLGKHFSKRPLPPADQPMLFEGGG